MTLFQLIRAIRWLQSVDDPPRRSDDYGPVLSRLELKAITARQPSARPA